MLEACLDLVNDPDFAESFRDVRKWSAYGRIIAGQKTSYTHHRPTTALNALPSSIGSVLATFSGTTEFSNMKSSPYGKSVWWGVFDGSGVAVGDYLIGQYGTFFVATQEANLPMLCVQCNRTISVFKTSLASKTHTGADALMSGWSCSILEAGRKGGDVDIGDSLGQGTWQILLPHFSGITITTSNTLTDDMGNRYMIRTAELSDLGWRIWATRMHV